MGRGKFLRRGSALERSAKRDWHSARRLQSLVQHAAKLRHVKCFGVAEPADVRSTGWLVVRTMPHRLTYHGPAAIRAKTKSAITATTMATTAARKRSRSRVTASTDIARVYCPSSQR